MTREVELVEYLPQVYRDIEEFQEIMKVEEPIINSLWQNVQNVYDDSFISTSTEYSLDRRYEFLGMPIIPGESLETRRFKLLARYQEQAPYTWRVINRILDNLLGNGNYEFTRNVAANTVEVKMNLALVGEYNAVVELLERTIPVDMIITVGLLYNTNDVLSAYTHDELSAYTHNQLREEVL